MDESKDNNAAGNGDDGGDEGRKRSKWLDSLIERLDDEDSSGDDSMAPTDEPKLDLSPDENAAAVRTQEATEAELKVLEQFDSEESEESGEEPAPEMPAVELGGEDLMMLRSGEYQAMPDVVPPPTPPPVPAAPAPAVPSAQETKDEDDEGLTFEIGEEIEDDAPYGVSEPDEAARTEIELAPADEPDLAQEPESPEVEPIDLELEADGETPAAQEQEPEQDQTTPEQAESEEPEIELEARSMEHPGPSPTAPELQATVDVELDDVDEEGPTIALQPGDGPAEDLDDSDDEEPAPSVLALALQMAEEDDPLRMEAALVREAQSVEEPRRKALLEHELGHLLQERLDNESRAAKAYAQALNLDPNLRPNVWAIARIFSRRELWTNLVKLYDAQIRFEQDDQRRAEILLEKGWMMQDRMGDLAGARESFWAAYQAHESWLAPLLALEQLDVAQGDMDDMAQVLRHMAETAQDPARRTAVLMDLARMQEQLSGGNAQVALMLLERARAEGVNTMGVVELAEQIAARAGMHREQVDSLQQQAALLLAQEPPSRLEAAARLREAARVAHEDAADLPRAQQLLQQAMEQLPDEPLLQRDMLSIAEEMEDWEQVERQLASHLERSRDDQERAALTFRLGLARIRSGSPEATSTLDEALAVLPGYLPALAEKERRLLNAGDVEGLAALYVAEADAVEQGSAGLPLEGGGDPDWAVAALWRAAALHHRHLESPDRAIELCRRSLALRPGFQPAVDLLERLLRETGQHQELADFLAQQAEDASDEQVIYLQESLIALCTTKLDQPERTLEALLRLHQRDRDDLSVLRRVAQTMQRLGRNEQLEDVLQQLERLEPDVSLQVQWKLCRAQIHDARQGSSDEGAEEALAIYQEILRDAPTHPYAFPAAENLLRRLGRHEDLVRLLRRAADDTLDHERKCDLLVRAASVARRHLQQPGETAAIFGELVELRPDDPVVLRELVRAALDAGDNRRLADSLEHLVELEQEPGAQVRHLIRLAEMLQDSLDEPIRAEEMLRRAVEVAPATSPVIDAIDSLAQRQIARGDFMEAGENLERLTREGPEEARNVLIEERAWLAGGPLGDTEQAAELWDQVLEADSSNLRALFAKQRLAARGRDALALGRLLARQAAVVEDDALATETELRAGLLTDAAGDPDGEAADHYRKVLARDPDNVEALTSLAARSALSVEEQADVVARLAQIAPDRVREEMRLELADLFEKAGRARDAGRELVELLRRDAQSLPGLLVLQRLAQAAGDRELESKVWVRAGGLLFNKAAKAEAFARSSELLEQLERPTEAAVLLRHVLALKPHDEQAFQRLRSLYQESGNREGLEELLGHRIRNAAQDDRSALIRLHFERAELRVARGDSVGAARDMGQILKLDPQHLEALRQLARLYDEDNNPRRALVLYSRYLEAADSRSLRRPAVLRVAQLLHRLRRSADAVDVCRKFLEVSPDDEQVLEQLVDLYVEVRDFARSIETMERLGELREEPEWKAENLRRIAGLHWKELKDLQEARTTLLRARDVDPCNVDVVDDLRQLSEQMGLHDDLNRLLERTKDDLREALASSPLDPAIYRKLMRVAEWHEDTYTLLAAMGALCLLGSAEAEDQELYSRRMSMVGFEPRRQVGAQTWRNALLARGAKSAFGEIWAVIAETVTLMYQSRGVVTDPAALNVGRPDRVDRRTGGPVSQTIDPIASVFGLSDFDIYMSPDSADLIAGVVGERPALVVGHKVVTTLDTTQRFHVGRTMSLLRDRAFVLQMLSREELELVFAAAIFRVEPSASLSLPRSEVEPEAQRLYKALPRKARKALPLAVTRFMQEGGDLDAWVEGVLATADRCGLLACGDILVAMGEIVEELRMPSRRAAMSTDEIAAAVRDTRNAAQTLVYSVSVDYLGLRKELQV